VAEICFVCGKTVDENDRVLLVRGRAYWVHCSQSCLRENVRKQRLAKTVARRGWFLGALLLALALAGGNTLWHRHRLPPAEVISSSAPEALPETSPPEPVQFGPAWPPTDEDWITAFTRASWIYPLPGPSRRIPTVHARIFGPDPPKDQLAAVCRKQGHCGVDLGGDLWGEHVYAVHDGIVDRVQASGGEERGGQYVRLAHFGGMVFTQYFHLAAIPRGLVRGARVKAGDVIGLLGDTGLRGARRHLHFALSIRPSTAFSEVYWDPKPWMEQWPLRLPPHGTVAGFAAAERDPETPRRRRSR
jgi:murein DD-endopeptidase MepM/ murein hydrolase activator NlpD